MNIIGSVTAMTSSSNIALCFHGQMNFVSFFILFILGLLLCLHVSYAMCHDLISQHADTNPSFFLMIDLCSCTAIISLAGEGRPCCMLLFYVFSSAYVLLCIDIIKLSVGLVGTCLL